MKFFYFTLSIKEGLTLLIWKFSMAMWIIVDCRDFWKIAFQKDLHPVVLINIVQNYLLHLKPATKAKKENDGQYNQNQNCG